LFLDKSFGCVSRRTLFFLLHDKSLDDHMTRTTFHLKDIEDLRNELDRLGLELPLSDDFSIFGEPLSLGDLTTPNRFVAHPMEGFDSADDGTPGELSFRRYRRFAEGGVGLIWAEATAVMHEARSNAHQLCLYEKNVDVYARLVEETREAARRECGHEIVMLVQLTHSGRYSKPFGTAKPLIAHRSPILDPLHGLAEDYPVVTDEYLDRLQDVFVDAAKLAAQAGFDGIDLKSCHRYLMSELLASHTREGKYGGSLENRSRLLRETLGRIRNEVPELFVSTRLNVFDAIPYPYGFGVDREDGGTPDLTEPLELIGQLREFDIPLLNATIGNPYYNPHYGRPYDRPIQGFNAPAEDPLAGVARFVSITRQLQEAYPDLPIVGGGYTWLRHLMPYVAAGVLTTGGATLIGQGRGMFAYPDSVKDILKKGAMDPRKACVTCSGCTQIMRDGTMTGCVVRDSEIYVEQYKLGRRFATDRLKQEASRCENCEFPTCQDACPASVAIPQFLHAFAEGDVKGAYDVLRANNVLPEMCGCVCPSEVQCEGACVERIFDDRAIPIRDIQRVVSRQARLQGLAGLRLPETKTGKRVAVVGGGPAGLSCAISLLERGHEVALFERGQRLGGTPGELIPSERYGEATPEIDAILEPALKAGVLECEFGRSLGADLTLAALREEYDAVFLGVGLGSSTSIISTDEDVEGVLDALAFLEDAKSGRLASMQGRVAVLGAGNTAMDAAVQAAALGADDVYVAYRRSFAEMPAWETEREHAVDVGCHFLVLTQPVGYETDENGKLTGLQIVRTELGSPDASGRRRPLPVHGTESVLPVDWVVEAIGQRLPDELTKALEGVRLNERGLIEVVNDSFGTSLGGVFAGGDLVNGGTTAVQAVAEGMRAAQEIDAVLG